MNVRYVVFVPVRPFQPSLMFLSKVPGLTHQHYTMLEKPAKDNHSSRLRAWVNYGHKRFYNFEPKQQRLENER